MLETNSSTGHAKNVGMPFDARHLQGRPLTPSPEVLSRTAQKSRFGTHFLESSIHVLIYCTGKHNLSIDTSNAEMDLISLTLRVFTYKSLCKLLFPMMYVNP